MPDTFLSSRGRAPSRLLVWARDNTRRATGIGIGLLLVGATLIALPPHSILLGVLFALPTVLILSAVVSARAPQRWWAVIAVFASCWCVSTLGVGVDDLLLQVAGHVESCRYVNSIESPDGKYGGTKTTYILGCPDGPQKFTTVNYVPVNHGLIQVRTAAGGLFGISPAGQSDLTLFFVALPGPIGLAAIMVAARRTPRSAGWMAAEASPVAAEG